MDLTQLNQYATAIAGLLAALLAFWRYIVYPGLKVTKKIHNTSEELSKALPILLELSRQFSYNNKSTLLDKINYLDSNTKVNLELIRSIGNKLNIAWYQSDANGDCVYISNRLGELMGITLDQAKGSGWKNSVCEDHRDNVIQEWADSVKEKREFDLSYAYCHKLSNKRIPIHTHSYTIKNSENQVIGFIGIVTQLE